jgi:hypothetical protein
VEKALCEAPSPLESDEIGFKERKGKEKRYRVPVMAQKPIKVTPFRWEL